jgi:hypothetical protein
LNIEPDAIAPQIELPSVEATPEAAPVPMQQEPAAPAIPKTAQEAIALGSPPCSINPRFITRNEQSQPILKAPQGALIDRSQKFGDGQAACWGHVSLLVYNAGVDEAIYTEFIQTRPPSPRP